MPDDLRARLDKQLGRAYTIERELGGGGMSRVFVATETSLHRPVVIKVLPPELAALLSTDGFRQEIEVSARLQHPHIVPLLTAGEADGLLYYTMPLRFLRKYRSLGYYALLLVLAADSAEACSVCFGNPESPMTKSVVAGVWMMLGCIGSLLAAFAGLFLYWTYRSYHVHLYRDEGATN